MNIFFWSGGYDSTYLIHEAVKTMKKGEHLTAWTLDWDMIGDTKIKSEELCRKSYIEYAREIHGVEIDNRVISLRNTPDPGGSTIFQATLFLPLCAYLAPEDSTIVFGFHGGDDFWQYQNQLDLVRQHLTEAMKKKVTFDYPLRLIRKWLIVKTIRENGLERFCWTCEEPKEVMKPCGKCLPCITLETANREITLRNELFPDRINLPQIESSSATNTSLTVDEVSPARTADAPT